MDQIPQPPRLPPRKSATPSPPEAGVTEPPGPSTSNAGPVSSTVAQDPPTARTEPGPPISEPVALPLLAGATSPPPLPRRRSMNRPIPVPSPVTIPSGLPAAEREHEPSEPTEPPEQPLSSVTVAITPATPADSEAGTAPTSPSFGQSVAELTNTPVTDATPVTPTPDGEEASMPTRPAEPPVNPQPSVSSTPPALPARRPQPPPLPPRRSPATHAAVATAPSLAWILYTAVLVTLAYLKVSLTGLALAALAGYIGVKRVEVKADEVLKDGSLDEEKVGRGEGSEAVEWVNHALYALFPLISTDVLTPFVDLLEDALAEQVPPIVTSVRLASPALGSQPLLLTSLRPVSDEEWFSSLSTGDREASKALRALRADARRRNKSASSKMSNLTPSKLSRKHARNVSSGSAKSLSTDAPLSRSRSASSVGSGFDAEDIAQETQRRRKRDRIIQKVSRRHAPAAEGGRQRGSDKPTSRNGQDGDRVHDVEDPVRSMGGSGDNDMDEDDPDAGQYVNYQVGFEYKRSKDAEKMGRGLHCLAYFGWGVKGVGKSEIPVYIDVLSIKGTLNLRLLLSATPPFVRTGTFSFPSLPEYDVSAHPLKKSAFNAMELPGMKHYVKQSIMKVAAAFVRPNSYTIDLDRLLLGRETSLRAAHIGVLHIIIHRAEDLPKADTMGSCDPYVSISLSKFHKPLFSTRTIGDTRDPVWDEEAFVLVSADAIEAGEKLRLRTCDSDRFSADDAVGVVELDLAELVDCDTDSSKMTRRRDQLQADRPGMKTSGLLEWSVQFRPLWQMSPEETQARVLKAREERTKFGEPPEQRVPWWMEWIEKMVDGKDEKWLVERQKRRKETMAWFTGEKERDELEAGTKPSEDFRSGILQFHIHQCVDLEVEPNNGTYSSHQTSSRSAANGKPALASLVDRTAAESPDPPSAYTEVHLNDKLVYRTRTKQVTPLPYFNAVSERFVRDWTKGKVVFVVRDERNREHDPILGIVVIPLREAFRTRSQFTRWFPLVGGLGWGRLRISLLWKPIDMSVPRGLSGFEVASLRLRSFSFTSFGLGLGTDKSISVLLQTDADKYELDGDAGETSSSTPTAASAGFTSTSTDGFQSPLVGGVSMAEEVEMEFDLSPRHVRLAIMYRHSCSLVVTFVSRSSVLKKKKVLGVGVVRLPTMSDGEGKARVGVWGTTDVSTAMRMEERERSWAAADSADEDRRKDSEIADTPRTSRSVPDARTPEKKQSFRRRISERRSWPIDSPSSSRPDLGPRSSRSSVSLRSASETSLLGWAELSFNLIPGIGKVHRKVAKRDLRFAKVYEAWEASREIVMGWDKMGEGERLRAELEGVGGDGDSGSESEDDESSESEDEDGLRGKGKGSKTEGDGARAQVDNEVIDSEDENEDEKKRPAWREHSHALHKRHKGVFQLKIARTGRFVKDKIGAKIHSAANSGGNKDGRYRGTDMNVEKEGVSRM